MDRNNDQECLVYRLQIEKLTVDDIETIIIHDDMYIWQVGN